MNKKYGETIQEYRQGAITDYRAMLKKTILTREVVENCDEELNALEKRREEMRTMTMKINHD